MDHVDLRGLSCPAPVLETKRYLEEKETKEIEVRVDDAVAKENVKRFLESKGFKTAVIEEGKEYRIQGNATGQCVIGDAAKSEKNIVIYIDGVTMGRGDDKLGEILMGAFMKTIKDLETRPWRLILINAGVKLAATNSAYLSVLKTLDESGIEVLCCGTCLDYYGLKGDLGVGRISDMFEIMSSLSDASHVIRP